LSRAKVERVITACEKLNSTELGKLLALLRRFEAEAASEDARDFAERLREEAEGAILIAAPPANEEILELELLDEAA
jgi:repressor of nif and glnA expression